MRRYFWWFVLLIIVLSIVQVWPLMSRPGFFVTHDGNVTVVRTYELDKVLKDGQFPPRWAPDLAFTYGYPIFNFFYPLPNFFSELFHFIGFNFTDSVKVVFSLTMIGGGLGMFFLGKKLWGGLGGLLSAIIYMFAPYRAVELYVRGSLPELLVLMWLPLLFLAGFEWVKQKKAQWGLVLSIILALIILSHNILVLVILPILILYLGLLIGLTKSYRPKFLLYTVSCILYALLLTSFFWLPALVEKKYTIVDEAIKREFNFRDHFVYPSQLIYSPWGYGGSRPGSIDGMSFRVGKEFVILAFLAVVTVVGIKEKLKKWLIIFFATMAVGTLFMALNISAPIWEFISFLFYIQYPWRFYSLLIFALAVIGGAVVKLLPKRLDDKRTRAVILGIVFYFVLNNLRFFQTSKFPFQKEAEIINREKIISQTTGYADENLPIWVKQKPNQEPKSRFAVLDGSAEIELIESKSHLYRASIMVQQATKIRFNQFYFPGWKIFVDGYETTIDYDNDFGIMEFQVKEGRHEIMVQLVDTAVRKISNYISLFSYFAITVLAILNFYHGKSKIKIKSRYG